MSHGVPMESSVLKLPIIQIMYNLSFIVLYSTTHFSAFKLTAASSLLTNHVGRTVEISFLPETGIKVHC